MGAWGQDLPGKPQRCKVPQAKCWSGPLENHKATQPELNVGHSLTRQRNTIEWCFAGGPMMTTMKTKPYTGSCFSKDKSYFTRAYLNFLLSKQRHASPIAVFEAVDFIDRKVRKYDKIREKSFS